MIHMKQNDRKPTATSTLSYGTVAADLTNATSVTFKMRRHGDITLKVDSAAVIDDAANGEVSYHWAAGDTDTSDIWFAEWEVLWNDGTTETFPTIGNDIVAIYGDLDS